jgi:hypothetical protein
LETNKRSGRVEAKVGMALLTAARIINWFWTVGPPSPAVTGVIKLLEGSMNRFWLMGSEKELPTMLIDVISVLVKVSLKA